MGWTTNLNWWRIPSINSVLNISWVEIIILSARRPELPPEETEALSGFFWVGSGVFQGEDRVHEQCFQLFFMWDTFFPRKSVDDFILGRKVEMWNYFGAFDFHNWDSQVTLGVKPGSTPREWHVQPDPSPVLKPFGSSRWFWDGSGPGGPNGSLGGIFADNSNLGGGFEYLLFSPRKFGEDSHFDSYFSKGLKPPTSNGSTFQCEKETQKFFQRNLFYLLGPGSCRLKSNGVREKSTESRRRVSFWSVNWAMKKTLVVSGI